MGLALLLFGVAPLRATSVLPPRFEALVNEADLIFTGQVIAQRAEWRNLQGQKSIVTLVTFGVQATHKGRAGSTVTLQFLGGTIGDVSLDVSEMPRFKPGERALLFVEKNGTMACPLVGWEHGRFSVQKAGPGKEMIFKHDGTALSDVTEIGAARGPAQARVAAPVKAGAALSHEEFAEKIRARVLQVQAQGGGK